MDPVCSFVMVIVAYALLFGLVALCVWLDPLSPDARIDFHSPNPDDYADYI